MNNQEAIEELKVKYLGDSDAIVQAKQIAIRALEKQTNVKNCIARLNQKEYKHIVWTNDNLIQLLSSFIAEGGESNG